MSICGLDCSATSSKTVGELELEVNCVTLAPASDDALAIAVVSTVAASERRSVLVLALALALPLPADVLTGGVPPTTLELLLLLSAIRCICRITVAA